MNIDYISEITTMGEDIGKSSSWPNNELAFGTISEATDNYIYEFYCLVRVLHDLSFNHRIMIISGNNGFVFPQKPTLNIQKFARFQIFNTNDILYYTVLNGISIQLTDFQNTTVAPDITFVEGNVDNQVDETCIKLIMDAKWKVKNNTSLEISTMREMAEIIHCLGVSEATQVNLNFFRLTNMKNNCIITNSISPNNHEDYCSARFFIVINNFSPY